MVATIRSDAGASRWLLRAALERRRGLTLVVSVPLLIEYEAVMTRAEHLNASTLSVGDVETLLDAVVAVAVPVQLAYLWRPTLPDADDDMVLEVAVNGRTDGIVTFSLSDFDFPSCLRGRRAQARPHPIRAGRLANVLARLPDPPVKRIDELLPWSWCGSRRLAA